MYLFRVCAAWLVIACVLVAPAFAGHGIAVRQQVVVQRQRVFVPRQRVVVAPFRQSFVQPLYAQPFVQQQFVQPYVQQFVQPQQFYAPQQFIVPQQFNSGYGVQQLQGGCANCFR